MFFAGVLCLCDRRPR